MNKWLLTGLTLLLIGLAGCTTTIYGVPQERWDVMSEPERIAAMDAYKARQAAIQERMREQARQRALAEEERLAREAEEARLQQLEIDAIYRGEGAYGDLLRVTLYDGMLKFYGAHQPFRPVSFKLAAGEAKEIEVVSQRGKRATLLVSYDGGNLLLDDTPRSHRSLATSLVYDDDWSRGKAYPNLYGKGPLELHGVSASVEIVGTPPREHHARNRPRVIVVERPAPKPEPPQVIVIKEQPKHTEPPQVIVIKEQPKHTKPQVVVVNEQPAHRRSAGKDGREQPRPEQQRVTREQEPPAKPRAAFNKQPVYEKPGKAGNEAADGLLHKVARRGFARAEEPAGHAGPPAAVSITFQSGKLKYRGKASPLLPQSVVLNQGDSRTLTLKSQRGAVKLQLSYLDGELQIDHHPGRKGRQTRLGYDSSWKTGHKYRIEDTDREQLEELDILVLAK
jgi:hypothetical protein